MNTPKKFIGAALYVPGGRGAKARVGTSIDQLGGDECSLVGENSLHQRDGLKPARWETGAVDWKFALPTEEDRQKAIAEAVARGVNHSIASAHFILDQPGAIAQECAPTDPGHSKMLAQQILESHCPIRIQHVSSPSTSAAAKANAEVAIVQTLSSHRWVRFRGFLSTRRRGFVELLKPLRNLWRHILAQFTKRSN